MTVTPDAARKIVIVSSYPFEDTNAAKARIASFRAAIQPLGKTFVLCRRGSQNHADPTIVSLDFSASMPRNFFLRGLTELSFSLRLMRQLHRMKPDLVIVTVPSLFLLAFGYLARTRLIFDLRDLVWVYLPELSTFDRVVKRILARWSLSMLRRAPIITVTNVSEKAHLQALLGPKARIVVVANGLARDRFEVICARVMPAANEAGPRNVLYVGNVGLAQDLETLVRTARQRPRFHFIVVGNGNGLPRLRALIVELGVNNVDLVDGMSWTNLIEYYQKADVLYAQIGAQYHTAVPSKLSEYMVVGRPLVFGGIGASREWLSRFSGVAVIAPSDPDAFAEALDGIEALAANMDVAANRRLVEANYIRDDQATIMANLVREQLGRNERQKT